jgi:hypothetical protein
MIALKEKKEGNCIMVMADCGYIRYRSKSVKVSWFASKCKPLVTHQDYLFYNGSIFMKQIG